jgi:peptidoglycan hydrolase CwlO-like protein
VSLSGWGGLYVEYANRQDAVKQTAKVAFDNQIDGRIDKKPVPISSELHEKTDAASVTHQMDALRTEQRNALQSIHDAIEKSNGVVSGTKEDIAKLTGKLDALEKDVNLLLQRQLRSAADLPSDVLAS